MQVTRLEVLHKVAGLLCACFTDTARNEVGDDVVRLRGGAWSAMWAFGGAVQQCQLTWTTAKSSCEIFPIAETGLRSVSPSARTLRREDGLV